MERTIGKNQLGQMLFGAEGDSQDRRCLSRSGRAVTALRDLSKPHLDLERMCLASGCDPFGNEVILQLPRKQIPTELAVWQE
ncbi:hypothetical protein AV530_018110 [Patagioenas fasciata monilis]|uniref:Uncharacterized protein n=1 Tax=Patagioenas fasciata monilis TaxID=372326 RepID=A0A1V4KMS4_PATFA|nr:hypothetical protein AV530_018110 [Patagioenas fasciata monilis]